jgi:hypothetical protein
MTLRLTNAGGCPMGDGVAVLKADGTGRFTEVTAGSDFGFCPVAGVPAAIAEDFGLCRTVRPTRHTYVFDFLAERLRFKPRRLPQGAHGLYGSVRWSSWTRTQARGRAVLDYADAYEQFRVPVRVRLYRARQCQNGVWIFTRRKVTAVRAQDRKRIAFDARSTAYGTCAQAAYAPRS